MPSHRLSPARSLQKLRTVFSQPQSPTTTTSPTAPSPLNTTTATTASCASPASPTLTVSPTPSFSHQFASFAGFSFGNNGAPSPTFNNGSSPTFASPEDFSSLADSRRVIRRKKSCVEIEIERERVEFDGALVGIVEPRPRIGVALGGIEEVLCGEV